MNDFFRIISDYLKGKPVYSSIRRILTLLFNISISSFFYEQFYGEYTWYDFNDYKAILDFFIKGKFFIPFSIFVTIQSMTWFVSFVFFELFTRFKTKRWVRKIVELEFNNQVFENRVEIANQTSQLLSPTTNDFKELYGYVKSQITNDMLKEIQESLRNRRKEFEANFCLCLRSVIAISLYFYSLKEFGWILFLIVSITLVSAMYIMLMAACVFDVLPTLVAKIDAGIEKYLAES